MALIPPVSPQIAVAEYALLAGLLADGVTLQPLLATPNGDGTYSLAPATGSAVTPKAPTLYRSSITAADVIAIPGTCACTKQAGGSATAGIYNSKVVAGNIYGRTTAKAGDVQVTTETTNLTVRIAFAQVTGATYYDIYCSTDADPKWVGRITEAQRASGILITAVGVTGAGGAAGAVDVQVPGTGLQAATTATVNNAYIIPAAPINCAGYQYCDFDLAFVMTGDAVTPALILVPFFQDSLDSAWYAGASPPLVFGNTQAIPLQQRIRVEVRGSAAVALVVAAITGTGASLTVRSILS